ncbi:MAG: hypothetical protein KTR27_07295 [Leptolyngbyaceae cyanobacterium MAG.088]|nr:hypothetical protein [Leptolyngbyaceae cyanobacterium MAG.088]
MYLEPLVETHQTMLTEALEIARCLRRRGDCSDENKTFYQRQQTRLQSLQTDLAQWQRHQVKHQTSPIKEIPLTVRQAFVRAALLTRHYHQLAGHQWQGTIPSPTLSKQLPDDIPAILTTEDAIVPLCQHFQLSSQDQRDVIRVLNNVDERIAHQATVIQATLSSVGLANITHNSQPNLQLSKIQAAVLFKHLFGITVPANVIDIVFTPLQIYFCLSAEQSALAAQVPSSEQQQLAEVFETMQNFSFDQFRRFPTFGPCKPSYIDTTWVTPMAQQLQEPVDSIVDALSSSVSILPTAKAEAFLIHDIWGHYWQLMMTQFEADYAILGHCDEPLRAGETAYTDQGPVTCRELFSPTGDDVSLDEHKAHAFFHGEVKQRLGLVFTHLIGEMMADVAEFKFVWCHPQSAEELLSSSVFKAKPVKLDLSLLDLDFLFIRVIDPLMKINISALETSPLEQEILASWKTKGVKPLSLELKAHLKQKLSRLHELFLDDYRQHYLSSLKSSTGLFGQAATNLVYLQNTINHLCVDACRDVTAETVDQPQLYHDLLMIFIGCFCSGDGYSNFWQMDAVLAQYFLPCWHLLHEWIRERGE